MHLSFFLGPAIWLLKSVAYVFIFRLRSIKATYLNCLIIAGAPLLLGFVPLPLPGFVSVPLMIALAVYLTMHYTGVSLIPDGLFIPLGIEVSFRFSMWMIQELASAT